MRKRAMRRHYSGHQSRPFWSRLNRLRDRREYMTLYLMGCHLQDMESRLLQLIAELESTDQKGK